MPKYSSFIHQLTLPKASDLILHHTVYPHFEYDTVEDVWREKGLSLATLRQMYDNITVISDAELTHGIRNLTHAAIELGRSIYERSDEIVGAVDQQVYFPEIKAKVFRSMLGNREIDQVVRSFYDQEDIKIFDRRGKVPENMRYLDRVFTSNTKALALGLWEMNTEAAVIMRNYIRDWTTIPENGLYEGYIASTRFGLKRAKAADSTLIANLYNIPVVKDILERTQMQEISKKLGKLSFENTVLTVLSTSQLQNISSNFFPFITGRNNTNGSDNEVA